MTEELLLTSWQRIWQAALDKRPVELDAAIAAHAEHFGKLADDARERTWDVVNKCRNAKDEIRSRLRRTKASLAALKAKPSFKNKGAVCTCTCPKT